MNTHFNARVFFVTALLNGTLLLAQGADPAVYQFGKVGLEAEIRHTFTLHNDSSTPMEIRMVQLTPPLKVTQMSRQIPPGTDGAVTVEYRKPLKPGRFEGGVVVHFKGEAHKPAEYFVEGNIVPAIEFIPFHAAFMATQRGVPKSIRFEIVNHEAEPMDVSPPECDHGRFDCELAVLEAGRRFSVLVTLKGEGPGAEQSDTITLPTSSRGHPFLSIKILNKIRERVYAFPDAIDFETISPEYLKVHPQELGMLNQSLTVFQTAGTNFQISAETDIPFFRVSSFGSAEYKDRYGVSVSVDKEKLKSGPVKGSVTITTNDPEFPKLVIPVVGRVEGNW